MYKTISVLFLTCICLSLAAVQSKNSENRIQKESNNSVYKGTLDCESKITIDTFQNCSFNLFKANEAVKKVDIFINGGMPAHQHGLPTSPKAIWSDDKQTYVIKGLKFSMPGKWVLNFNINALNASDKDFISMEINVD